MPELLSPDMVATKMRAAHKTRRWEIRSKASGVLLARVRWCDTWEQYCTFPALRIFDSARLRALANFLDEVNREHDSGAS